jgi:hypothetical protein
MIDVYYWPGVGTPMAFPASRRLRSHGGAEPSLLPIRTRETTLCHRALRQGDESSLRGPGATPRKELLRRRRREMQQQTLEAFPALKRWFEAIASRPSSIRAYARKDEVSRIPVVNDESRKILFGQTAQSLLSNHEE